MAEWVLIENDEIKEYHDLLPKSWKNYSGLNLSTNDIEFLNSIGWYRVNKVSISYNSNTHRITKYNYIFENNIVFEIPDIQLISEEEKNTELQNQLFSIRLERNRRLLESDWTQLPDVISSHTTEWNQAWIEYRQKLREVPTNFLLTNEITWPIIPNVAS